MYRTTPDQTFSLKGPSVVERVTLALREVALASQEGAYLGSDEGLTRQYNVSSPTLRQAARLLEHEGVLKVKRGVHGGYYADRPKIEAITRVGAIFLRTNANALNDIERVMDALTPLIVNSVIQSERLHELEGIVRIGTTDHEPEHVANLEAQFVRLLIDLTGNSVIQLIHAVVFQFGMTVPTQLRPSDAKLVQALRRSTIALAKALLEKDAEAAIGHSLEHRRMIVEGIRRSLSTFTATTQAI